MLSAWIEGVLMILIGGVARGETPLDQVGRVAMEGKLFVEADLRNPR